MLILNMFLSILFTINAFTYDGIQFAISLAVGLTWMISAVILLNKE